MLKTQKLTPGTLIQRNEDKFLASALGEEIVMMNTDNGDYIGVNSVGSDIWNMLHECLSVEVLVKKMLLLYDVSEEECALQINEFLERMMKNEMIVIQNSNESTA